MTLVEDDDDCKSHGFCEMLTDNFKIEALKSKTDMGHIFDRKPDQLLPTTFRHDLRSDEACAEYIKGQCESDTSLDAEDLD